MSISITKCGHLYFQLSCKDCKITDQEVEFPGRYKTIADIQASLQASAAKDAQIEVLEERIACLEDAVTELIPPCDEEGCQKLAVGGDEEGTLRCEEHWDVGLTESPEWVEGAKVLAARPPSLFYERSKSLAAKDEAIRQLKAELEAERAKH